MGDVYGKFLDVLTRHYTFPKAAEGKEEAFLADYAEDLGRYPDAVLERAARMIRSRHQTRTLPTIADCLAACREAWGELAPAQAPNHTTMHPHWDTRRIEAANRLIRSEVGRRAADEGWIVALWDFCREHERWPGRFEAEALKAASVRRRCEIAEAIEGWRQDGTLMPIITGIADVHDKRKNRLSKLARETQQ